MSFYRLAKEVDFISEQNHIEYLLYDSDEVINLIKEGSILKATKRLRDITSISLRDAKKLCDKYEACIEAFEAFRRGEKIYTEF